ncbi:hypothetical protein, variant [Batrachochytrium dendrobatidis JEL423]|uniref:Mitochondrial import inner membrane translocase subunit TIM50 n=1 Tax=Batrachochytrium dendrobatidis (strain JEL423) TaxID=403673 RepID=A0A177WPA5_BATDL|nr:hypothetical protein, variant [Batrachochytrium dendrobatidis JEL423]
MAQPKLLIVFDLNGTLLERLSSKEVKDIRSKCSFLPESSNYKYRSKWCFLRPHLNELIRFVVQQPHITIGVWTSAEAPNAQRLTELTFGPAFKHVSFVMDRSYCDHAPTGVKSHNLLKDVSKIWSDETLNPNGVWSNKNTILIDDSPRKFRHSKLNAIGIPTFTFVSRSQLLVDPNNDNSLILLVEWLRKIPYRNCDNIQEIIKAYPIFEKTNNQQYISASFTNQSSPSTLIDNPTQKTFKSQQSISASFTNQSNQSNQSNQLNPSTSIDNPTSKTSKKHKASKQHTNNKTGHADLLHQTTASKKPKKIDCTATSIDALNSSINTMSII